jgi:hypothetical protein
MEDPEINPYNCSHLIFEKDTRNLDICRRLKVEQYISSCQKLIQNGSKNLR